MIMISSTAGQRLARAKKEFDRAKCKGFPHKGEIMMARKQFHDAACAVADELTASGHPIIKRVEQMELIAGGHHETEEDNHEAEHP